MSWHSLPDGHSACQAFTNDVSTSPFSIGMFSILHRSNSRYTAFSHGDVEPASITPGQVSPNWIKVSFAILGWNSSWFDSWKSLLLCMFQDGRSTFGSAHRLTVLASYFARRSFLSLFISVRGQLVCCLEINFQAIHFGIWNLSRCYNQFPCRCSRDIPIKIHWRAAPIHRQTLTYFTDTLPQSSQLESPINTTGSARTAIVPDLSQHGKLTGAQTFDFWHPWTFFSLDSMGIFAYGAMSMIRVHSRCRDKSSTCLLSTRPSSTR